MDDPLPVRLVERVGDLDRRSAAICSSGSAPFAEPIRPASRLRGTPSRGTRCRPRGRRRRARRCAGARTARSSSPRARSAGAPRSAAERCAGSTLIATSRSEPRVLRLVDLAHPARARRREDLVGAEAGAGGERHRERPSRPSPAFGGEGSSARLPSQVFPLPPKRGERARVRGKKRIRTSLPQPGGPVQHDRRRRHGVAAERRRDHEALAVGRRRVLVARSAHANPNRKERLGHAGLKVGVRSRISTAISF